MGRICKAAALVGVGLLGLGVHSAQAQDIAESAAMNSHSSIAAHSAKAASAKIPSSTKQAPSTSNSSIATHSPKAPFITTVSPANQSPSSFLVARSGPPLDAVNRKDFEDNAGKEAGKLLLRSTPSGAEVFINDRLVGRTPLLMLIAPGKYEIDMRGPRQESGHTTVGLMPKETQIVAIRLNQRYPTNISIR
jgi:hypothetical protein